MSDKVDKNEVIYLPGDAQPEEAVAIPSFDELTPREIVVELDKYIVGQAAAKRAVAVAVRNRAKAAASSILVSRSSRFSSSPRRSAAS